MTDANRPTGPQPDDRPAMTPEQARLHEALQRSRAIPLGGSMDADEAPHPFTDPTPNREPASDADGETPTGEAVTGDVHPAPGEEALRGEERVADDAGEAIPLPPAATTSRHDDDFELRSEADYERALAKDAEPQAPVAPTVAPTAIDPEQTKQDADTFAPLGISEADGEVRAPVKRSNRGFALLIAVIATMLFGVFYAAAFSLARVVYAPGSKFLPTLGAFIGTAPFYVAVAIFFVGLLLWSVLTNRGGWVSFVVAGLVLGVVSFLAYHLGVAVQQLVNTGVWDLDTMIASLRAPEHLPGALIAFFTAREVITWLGGIIALRGRKLTRENAAAVDEYERRRIAAAA